MAEKKAEIPDDRCGFELHPDNVGFVGSDQAWVRMASPVCCWRPVWESHDETEQCIWHADVDEKPLVELIAARADVRERLDGAILRHLHVEGDKLSLDDCHLRGARFENSRLQGIDFIDAHLPMADFVDADLRQANFTDADLGAADFTDADLRFSNFTDTDLRQADFTNADLRQADFTNVDLQAADLSDANVWVANFRHATLQEAVFTRTDCRRATFTSALLYDTVFSNTRINSHTTFYDPETTFYDSLTSRPGCVYEENPLITDQLPGDVPPLEAARWVYRRLEILHEENALSEDAREFHISKEEADAPSTGTAENTARGASKR